MADKKGTDSDRSLQEIIAEVTEKELAQYPDDIMSVDEIKAMMNRRALKAKNRRLKILTAAALFMVVAIGALMVFDGLLTDVEADKNAPEEIVTEDGVVIEDGGWGSEEDENWIITDFKETTEVKQHVKQLLIPRYVSDGFIFKMLKINILNKDSFICTYSFMENDEELIIEEYIHTNNLESLQINDVEKTLKSNYGDIYLRTKEGIKIATIQMDDGIIVEIRGTINDKEVLKIIDSLE